MSALLATATPRRIKASHRRRWKRSTGHSGYANNNPYTFVDPDGRESAMFQNQQYRMPPPDPATARQALGAIADFTPVVGDIKGFVDAYNDPNAVNIIAAGVSLLPVVGDTVGKAIKVGSGIIEVGARGRAAEARVLSSLGEVKNTELVSTSKGRTIPDFQNPTQVGEIKDTARVSDSAQLRAQREHAQATGRDHVVVTGTNTQVSGTVRGQSTVVRRDDLGPGGQ